MRYITQHANLALYQYNGKVPYRFGPDGVLVVGSLTTDAGAGNYIDADLKSDIGDQLQRVPGRLDHDGAALICIDMCGLGSLNSVGSDGTALATLVEGYNGFFFKAPVLSNGTAVPAVAGIYYKVLTGSITYNSVVYVQNEEFATNGSATSTSGTTGTFALTIPPALKNEITDWVDEAFAQKHLLKGNEPYDYYTQDSDGYVGRDSLTSTDADYYGWME